MHEHTSPTGVRSDTGPFAIIPEWLIDADVSDRAIRLYAMLARYADRNGESFPSRKTLAERLKCSLDSIDRAKKELVDAGALRVEERRDEGGQRSNLYTILRVGGRTHEQGALGMGPAQNESHVERESPSDSPATAGVRKTSGPGGPDSTESSSSTRKPNLVWEALAAHFDPQTPSERSNVGKTERELRAAMLATDEVLASEIDRRMAAYWPDLTRTPQALRNRWSELGRRADERATQRAGGASPTREEVLAANGPCQGCGGSGSKTDIPYSCGDCGGTGIEGWVL